MKYRNHTEKTEAFMAMHDLIDFLRQSGHEENAKGLENNLLPFIAKIPVKNQNPCRY